MAWVACLLFVRCGDLDAVGAALMALLRDRAPSPPAPASSDEPPPLTVTPAQDGWLAILGLSNWALDLDQVAGELSRRCATRVVCAEIFGQALRLRLAEHRDGSLQNRIETPEHGWDDQDTEAYRGPMPRYVDVEQRAYTTLRGLGLPASLIVSGTRPLGAEGDARPVGTGMRIFPPCSAPSCQTTELLGVAFSGDDAPVLARDASGNVGMTLFEQRYVEGVPSGAAVDQLIAIEQAFDQRAQRAAKAVPVQLTVTYHGGIHQDELDALLLARGRHVRPRPRRPTAQWWQFWRYFGTFGRRG